MAPSILRFLNAKFFTRLVVVCIVVRGISFYHQTFSLLSESYPALSGSALGTELLRRTSAKQEGLQTKESYSSSLPAAVFVPPASNVSTCNVSELLLTSYSFRSRLRPGKRRVCGMSHESIGRNFTIAICNLPISELEDFDFFVESGGHFRPQHCLPKTKVAIIIPFRNRWQHLSEFLLNMHPFLQKQESEYTIYVINQEDGSAFNRGMLLNVGAVEASKSRNYDCFVFHDVDLIPENDGNRYDCQTAFRHLSVAVDKFDYQLPYETLVGGALAANRSAFESVNGYSNLYFGWGGEDDDFAKRLLLRNYEIHRYDRDIARYTMLRHVQDAGNHRNDERFGLLAGAAKRSWIDGLNTLQYTVSGITKRKLFTVVNVSINQDQVVQRFWSLLAKNPRLMSDRTVGTANSSVTS